jgi:hypothetical protein
MSTSSSRRSSSSYVERYMGSAMGPENSTALNTSIPNITLPDVQNGAHAQITETLRRSRSSSFIDRRWCIGRWSLGSSQRASKLEAAKKDMRARRWPQIDAVKLMFWMGFVLGPWCWLIGGWLIGRDEEWVAADVETARRGVLPLGNGGHSNLNSPSFRASGGRNSGSSINSSRKILMRRALDPWVFRCRIAAGLGGTIIVVALLIAAFVLGTTSG